MPFPLPIPTAPSEPLARAAYLKEWVPHAPTFHQRTQPWHALRAATCTAWSIASSLGVLPDDRSLSVLCLVMGSSSCPVMYLPCSGVFGTRWMCCILACKLSKGQRKNCHQAKIQNPKRSACPPDKECLICCALCYPTSWNNVQEVLPDAGSTTYKDIRAVLAQHLVLVQLVFQLKDSDMIPLLPLFYRHFEYIYTSKIV